MRINLLCLLGLGLIVSPVAAQTVIPPTVSKATDGPDDKPLVKKVSSSELAVVDKLRSVTDVGDNGFDILAFDTRKRTVRGTPFVVPGWAKGEVVFGANSKALQGVLKFDVFNQQVRALRPQGDSIIISPDKIQGFTIRPTGANGTPEERRFERLPNGAAPEAPLAFAEVLSTGNELRLLKLQRKVIRKGQYSTGYNSSNPEDFYQAATQYFLRWSDGTVTQVKPTVGSIIGAVAPRQAAVAAAEMQKKTKAKSDAELGELVQRLNAAIPAK